MQHLDRLALLFAASLTVACTETDYFNVYGEATCIPVQWDAGIVDVGPDDEDGGNYTPPLTCTSTVECPPPLSCSIEPVGNTVDAGGQPQGTCRLQSRTIEPSAAIELYDVAEFTVAAEQLAGRDYTTLNFTGLPSNSEYVRCAWYNCPVDYDVLRLAPHRCLFDESVIRVTTATSVTLASADDQFQRPNLAFSETPACRQPDCTGPDCRGRRLGIPSVGFFTFCLAYSERGLVGASSIITLDVGEIGSLGKSTYVTECRPSENPFGGVACLRGEGELGVCRGKLCRGACWGDQNCDTQSGETCEYFRSGGDDDPDTDADDDGQSDEAVPWIGYCQPATCEGDCDDAPDGGVMTDSGPPSTPDSGVGSDSGPPPRPDSGAPDLGDGDADAGPEPDAGSEPDAGLPPPRPRATP